MSASGTDPVATIRPSTPSGPVVLPASNPKSNPGSVSGDDQSFALSLRLLSVLVLAALGGSIAFLAYRSLAPATPGINTNPNREASGRSLSTDPHPGVSVKPADEVLMAPNRVFRCEERGRVTFSDEACPAGKPDAR
jgi:hypothetical protein